MPVEVIKYLCKHKCGIKAVSSLRDMVRHEAKCWKNPENKSCKTCSNQIYGSQNRECFRSCKLPGLDSFFEEFSDLLQRDNISHIRPIFNCEYWNLSPQSGLSDFAEELRNEIGSDSNGTKHFPYYLPNPKVEMETATDLFGNIKMPLL